jgi:hypothetical protein
MSKDLRCKSWETRPATLARPPDSSSLELDWFLADVWRKGFVLYALLLGLVLCHEGIVLNVVERVRCC